MSLDTDGWFAPRHEPAFPGLVHGRDPAGPLLAPGASIADIRIGHRQAGKADQLLRRDDAGSAPRAPA